jgi:hypothetical protein
MTNPAKPTFCRVFSYSCHSITTAIQLLQSTMSLINNVLHLKIRPVYRVVNSYSTVTVVLKENPTNHPTKHQHLFNYVKLVIF